MISPSKTLRCPGDNGEDLPHSLRRAGYTAAPTYAAGERQLKTVTAIGYTVVLATALAFASWPNGRQPY